MFTPNITSSSPDGKSYTVDVSYNGNVVASFLSKFINELTQYGRTECEVVVEDLAGNVLIRMERQFTPQHPSPEVLKESMTHALDLFSQQQNVIDFLTNLITS